MDSASDFLQTGDGVTLGSLLIVPDPHPAHETLCSLCGSGEPGVDGIFGDPDDPAATEAITLVREKLKISRLT